MNETVGGPVRGSFFADGFAGTRQGGWRSVLFPLRALDHPKDDPADGGPGFLYGTNTGDAEVAQTIQTRLILAF